jgi:methylglutaconyl-CoA hydratase
MTDVIQTEIDAHGAATVWLNRPDLHNAFDDVLIGLLDEEFKRLEADPAVRVVVLAGRGKSFSAGADFNWMKRMSAYTETENVRDARALAEMLHTLNFLKKPTIAAVQGNAYGGGVGLVACCDIVFAVEQAHFAFTEVRLGLTPATISPYVIAAIGERQARRYFLTAESISAQDAYRIGLVHQLCEPQELMLLVAQTVEALASCGPMAQAAAKDLIRSVTHRPVDDAMVTDTARRIAEIRVSPEGHEGMASFLEKRAPSWRRS